MGIWTVAFGYAALRTVVATVVGWLAARRGAPTGPLLAQGVSDLSCVGVLTACVDYRVREALGLAGLLLAGYVIAWETWSIIRYFVDAAQDDVATDDMPSDAASLGRPLQALVRMFFVLPPVGAALLLAFGVLYPNALRFPGERPPMLCRPEQLRSDDTLVIEMIVPHGGELVATDPAARTLVVVPFAHARTPREQRFEQQAVVHLLPIIARGRQEGGVASEEVFRDTGTYTFQINAIPDVSGSLRCAVRYISGSPVPPARPGAAAPPPTR